MVQLENYDFVVIMETWWDDPHNWNIITQGYMFFRRDGQSGKGGGGECLLSMLISG